jgi:hypothetical protein
MQHSQAQVGLAILYDAAHGEQVTPANRTLGLAQYAHAGLAGSAITIDL